MKTSEQENAGSVEKSVQEVSKQKRRGTGSFAKTDVRYWQDAVFLPTYTRDGKSVAVHDWAAKVQHLGRRETFSLGTPNKIASANRAKEIYLMLKASGWEPTLAKFKPQAGSASRIVTTVGEFLDEVKAKAGGKAGTIEAYSRAFRTIVADIFDIDGGTAKFDYRTGGRDAWLAKVHAVKLADVTPAAVQSWKLRFLRRAGNDPLKQRAAKVSVNSFIRQAKSLFTPSVLKFIALHVPDLHPFDGVKFEPRQSMRYRSKFDFEKLISAAQATLPTEQFKIFLLAALAGLRRNEIDKLAWRSFQWSDNAIRIEATASFHAKSEESLDDVEVDPELISVFRGFRAKATCDFVIESQNEARPGATYWHYRCQRHFKALTKWLRKEGVSAKTPLHALRKEYGSQVCAKHGIYAASHALRHADIAITSQHYLDKRKSATVGLGHLLRDTENIIPLPASGATGSRASDRRRKA